MFDEILEMVKEHMGNNPEVSSAIPAEHADAIHAEIANHVSNAAQNPVAESGGMSGILSQIEDSFKSGGLATSAVTGGLVNSLASKFGLPPAVTGAIAASIPGLLQKYLNKTAEGPATVTPATT